MIIDFLITFLTIGIAELGDKTQLSILLISSKVKDHFRLLLGVILAFLIVDGAAVLLGAWVTTLVPLYIIKIVSGTVFILFGLVILLSKKVGGDGSSINKGAFFSGFALIFFSEWGDKTQIAAGLTATTRGAAAVFLGTMAALTVVSIFAVYLGRLVSERLDRKLISRLAGVLFILIGISVLILR